MSANQSDPVLERLNYFNGQRLTANDLRAEQGHHVGMRRVLNRSLYTAGIVVGLDVERAPEDKKDPTWKHRVVVRRGLAFDHFGREIFVPEDVQVLVMGAPSKTPGVVFGNLLVVSYRENRRHPAHERCAVVTPYKPCSGDMPWGAPTRIAAEWVFDFLDSWPTDESGMIVLGQIEMNSKCEVVRVMPGVRRYAVPAKPTTSHPLSIEGEKDIDNANPKFLHFHISDGLPDSVRLYLRGREFTSLYYTEMGEHNHSVTIPDPTISIAHEHKFKGVPKAKHGGAHRHSFWYADPAEGFASIDRHEPDQGKWILKDETQVMGHPIAESGAHSHDLDPLEFDPLADPNITIPIAGTIGDKGANLPVRTNTQHLTLINNLVVRLDSNNITKQICDQLEARDGVGKWLLVAAPNDFRIKGAALNASGGTGEIDLLKLGGVELGLGEHALEFRIMDANVGGNLQYNLYVK